MSERRYDPEQIREAFQDPVMSVQLTLEGDPEENLEKINKMMPQLYAVNKADALQLYNGIQQLGRYMTQMGQLLGTMQRRMDEMEARQAAVTISHVDVKRIQAMIRYRAGVLCQENNLQDKDSPRIIRAAIKKDVLKRHQVKDLHDLPAAMLSATETQIMRWTSIRLLMERRVST